MKFASTILLTAASAFADQVLMDIDFTEQPPEWVLTGTGSWTFHPEGYAECWISSVTYVWAKMVSNYVQVPAGTDSVVIDVPMWVSLSAYNGGAVAEVTYFRGGSWHQLMNLSVTSSDTTLAQTLHVRLPLSSGQSTALCFNAMAGGGGFEGGGSTHWKLFHLTLTAYGDAGLESTTWAGIKTPPDTVP